MWCEERWHVCKYLPWLIDRHRACPKTKQQFCEGFKQGRHSPHPHLTPQFSQNLRAENIKGFAQGDVWSLGWSPSQHPISWAFCHLWARTRIWRERDADLTELISLSILTWSWGEGQAKNPSWDHFLQKLRVLHFIGGGTTKPIVFREQTKTNDILKRTSLPQYLGQKKTLGESNCHAVRILKHLCGVAHVMKIRYFWPEASITAIHTGNLPSKWHPYSRWR